MYEESEASYKHKHLFDSLKARDLKTVWLVVSDAHKGLAASVRKSFVGASRQRCRVHFMRNIMSHIPTKGKKSFAAKLKQIWLQPDNDSALKYARMFMDEYMDSYIRLVTSYLIEYSEDWSTSRSYVDSKLLDQISLERFKVA